MSIRRISDGSVMVSDLLRVYYDPVEIAPDGYPYAWHKADIVQAGDPSMIRLGIKDLIRMRDGHRCLRCGHPYEKGMGQWSPCDEQCDHGGPARWRTGEDDPLGWHDGSIDAVGAGRAVSGEGLFQAYEVQAEWRILTVHHLNGVKHDCRWWNLVSLCQRCHLTIQGKVIMERVYPFEHSEWFKPFVVGYYAWAYEGKEITPEEAMLRMPELLAYERMA